MERVGSLESFGFKGEVRACGVRLCWGGGQMMLHLDCLWFAIRLQTSSKSLRVCL